MDNLVQNFSDFSYSLNEGNSYKKDYGIIGPFSPWGYKIKTCCTERGSEPTDSLLVIYGLDDDKEDICLKYLYGEGKESDPIYLPKGSFVIEGSPKNPILQTKRHTKWWDDEENQDLLDEFVNSFMESKSFKVDMDDDVEGDVSSIVEMLDLDSSVSKVDKKKDLHWIASLEDGTEIELKKRDKDNLFKVLKFYLGPDSYSPEVEVVHEKPGYEVIYSTPRGKFSRKCSTMGEMSKDPVHKYLFSTSMKKDPSLYQEPVLDYLKAVLKGHDWRPNDKKNLEEFSSSESEIKQLKKILLNTLTEEGLDEIYSSAREKYSPSSLGN
jgi:hypothetical protein